MTELESHSFHGAASGPRLIVLGAVHGNETCGTRAIRSVLGDLARGALQLAAGQLTLVPVTNPGAYERRQRAVDHNLNRQLNPKAAPKDYEDLIGNQLCPFLRTHDVLLDLHSFHTPGDPFALIGPRNNDGQLEPFQHQAAETQLALHLGPKRFVEGWMSVYETGVERRKASGQPSPDHLLSTDFGIGTTEYMRSQGGYAVTYECGQHDEPEAPVRARYAILQTLKLLGLMKGEPDAPPKRVELMKLVGVVDRLHEGDELTKEYRSFDRLQEGDVIGKRADGSQVLAERDGFIVFPNPGADVFAEWFYFAVESDRTLLRHGP
ncbi:MAG: succinylglutamate desuccinylase/aspartoacylase family protein [Myxococcota bacterium]